MAENWRNGLLVDAGDIDVERMARMNAARPTPFEIDDVMGRLNRELHDFDFEVRGTRAYAGRGEAPPEFDDDDEPEQSDEELTGMSGTEVRAVLASLPRC